MKKKVFEGLTQKGFTPVSYNAQQDPRLTIEIRTLDYSTSQGFWTGRVNIRGAMKAIAVNKGRSYDRMYKAEKEERIMVIPRAEDNELWINAVLSDILTKLFNDVDLFGFLST